MVVLGSDDVNDSEGGWSALSKGEITSLQRSSFANFAHKNERCTVVKKMRHCCCCVGGNGSGSGRSRWKADVRSLRWVDGSFVFFLIISTTYFTTPFSFVSRNGGDGCCVER